MLMPGSTAKMTIMENMDFVGYRFLQCSPRERLILLKQLVADNKALLSSVAISDLTTWYDIIAPWDTADALLDELWSVVQLMTMVQSGDDVQDCYSRCQRLIVDYEYWVYHNRALFGAVKRVEAAGYDLSDVQSYLLQQLLRKFLRSGVHLSGKHQQQLLTTQQRLADLGFQFERNVISSAELTLVDLRKDELEGLPKYLVDEGAILAQNTGKSGCVFRLVPAYYRLLMIHLTKREARQRLYKVQQGIANSKNIDTAVTHHQVEQLDNSDIVVQILNGRTQIAELMNCGSYASLVAMDRMAGSVGRIKEFLLDLFERCVVKAKVELATLQTIAYQMDGIKQLQSWDVEYYRERMLREQCGFSEEQERVFFPLDRVLVRIFKLWERLFAVRVVECTEFVKALLWHPTVRYFELYELVDDTVIGGFYYDPFVRVGKQSGAWAGGLRPRHLDTYGQLVKPVGYLVTNFVETDSVSGESLLSHDDLVTLLHEFGHLLQQLLSKVDYLGGSGTNGIPLDAIELASQFMENFAWQPESLQDLTEHYKTGEQMPDVMLAKLARQRSLMIGYDMLRQIEFGLIDLCLHDTNVNINQRLVMDRLLAVRKMTRLLPFDADDNFLQTFSHIFADGGYAAGYYSYLWAEGLAADAFELFKRNGVINRDLGLKFRDAILATGGSADPLELFKRFSGREPDYQALLRLYGIV